MASKFDIKTIETDLTEEELRTIYGFLINFFMGLLKPVTKSDLEEYVKKMTVFDLRPFLDRFPKHLRSKVAEVAQKNRGLVEKFITGETLTKQAKTHRPDLYKVFITPQGRIWVNRVMIYVRKLIFLL